MWRLIPAFIIFYYAIDWDKPQPVEYSYEYEQEELKPDENYPLTAVWYSEEESQIENNIKTVQEGFIFYDPGNTY